MSLLLFSPSGPVESGIKSFFPPFLFSSTAGPEHLFTILILELGHSKTGFQVSMCLSGEQFSIHPLSIYPLKVAVGLELIPAARGQRQGCTPDQSCFFVFFLHLADTERQAHAFTFTPAREFRVLNDAVLDVFDGRSQSSQRETKQAQREHANSEMLELE